MVGYGKNPPHPHWPGEAQLALQFVINYEEGAENSVLHGDPAAESFLSEIIGAQPIIGARHMNMESLYEYGIGHSHRVNCRSRFTPWRWH